MPSRQQFHIRNWAKFQHYKDRNPPWIKLHVEIFASEDWVSLDDASKLLAVVCMVIAAKHDGCVPDNLEYIRRVAYLKRLPNLKPLIDCGFLEKQQADASALQADASESKQVRTNVRPETETSSSKKSKRQRQKVRVEPRAEKARPPLRGTRWPSESVVPENWQVEAAAARKQHSLVDIDLTLESLKFQNYWASKTGASSTHVDWRKTWINWALKAEQTKGNWHGNGHGRRESGHEQTERVARELIAELDARDAARDHDRNRATGNPLPGLLTHDRSGPAGMDDDAV